MDRLSQLIATIDQTFAATAGASSPLILTVAACAAAGVALYALTRGREFLAFGCSATAFLIPLVPWH